MRISKLAAAMAFVGIAALGVNAEAAFIYNVTSGTAFDPYDPGAVPSGKLLHYGNGLFNADSRNWGVTGTVTFSQPSTEVRALPDSIQVIVYMDSSSGSSCTAYLIDGYGSVVNSKAMTQHSTYFKTTLSHSALYVDDHSVTAYCSLDNGNLITQLKVAYTSY